MIQIALLVFKFAMAAIPTVEELYAAYKGSGTEKKGHIMTAAEELIDGYNNTAPNADLISADHKDLVLTVTGHMIDGIVAGLNAKGGVSQKVIAGAEAAITEKTTAKPPETPKA